jgi:hypothetical protein
MTNAFGMIEQAVREIVEAKLSGAEGHVGGDMAYEPGDPLYVWLALIPGGRTDEIDGEWVLDIDVFGPDYVTAMQNALDLEAILVGPRHDTSAMRIDNCYQNQGPTERPWEDEATFRIGATYVFTARRTG